LFFSIKDLLESSITLVRKRLKEQAQVQVLWLLSVS